MCCDAALHLVDEPQREPAGDLLGRVEVIRQRDLVELGDEPRRADEVAEAGAGHRPRLAERAGDDERHVVVDELDRRPVGELAVGLVDHDQPGRGVDHGAHGRAVTRPDPVGLFGEHRNVTIGSAAAQTAAHLVEVEREVVAPLALGDARPR